jgi:hypothetical protein
VFYFVNIYAKSTFSALSLPLGVQLLQLSGAKSTLLRSFNSPNFHGLNQLLRAESTLSTFSTLPTFQLSGALVVARVLSCAAWLGGPALPLQHWRLLLLIRLGPTR